MFKCALGRCRLEVCLVFMLCISEFVKYCSLLFDTNVSKEPHEKVRMYLQQIIVNWETQFKFNIDHKYTKFHWNPWKCHILRDKIFT